MQIKSKEKHPAGAGRFDKKRKKKIGITALLLGILFLFCYLQNNLLTVSSYSYASPKLPPAFDGFRVVQISDLHNKAFGAGQRRLLSRVMALQPDLIVLTGDLIDGSRPGNKAALSFAEGAVAIAPVYFITGNHEYWFNNFDQPDLFSSLDAAGVTVLMDESVLIDRQGSSITVSGLDDNSLFDDTLQKMQLSADSFQLLLAHEPQYLPRYQRGGADLALTGHAHGGQFILPFIGAVYAPGQGFFPTYTSGMHQLQDTTMIISRGLGNSVIPLRLFNYPEIVCVTLHCSTE